MSDVLKALREAYRKEYEFQQTQPGDTAACIWNAARAGMNACDTALATLDAHHQLSGGFERDGRLTWKAKQPAPLACPEGAAEPGVSVLGAGVTHLRYNEARGGGMYPAKSGSWVPYSRYAELVQCHAADEEELVARARVIEQQGAKISSLEAEVERLRPLGGLAGYLRPMLEALEEACPGKNPLDQIAFLRSRVDDAVALLQRAMEALRRHKGGHAPMRIPADPEFDSDFVHGDIERFLKPR